MYWLWYQYKIEEDTHKEKVYKSNKDTSSSSSDDCPYSDKVLLQINHSQIDDLSGLDQLETQEFSESKPYFTSTTS